MGLTVREEEFDSLEAEWNALMPNSFSDTVFSTPLWQRIWWQELGQQGELLLYSFRKDGKLVGVAPMMRQNALLSFIGESSICDYLDFVVSREAEEEVYRALADHIESLEWESFSLSGIPAPSPTLNRIPSLFRDKGHSVDIRVEDVCPRLELSPTWDDYLATLTKKDRHELRRKMRRLEKAGDACYYAVEDTQHLDEFLSLLKTSRQDKARFMTPKVENFFRAMAQALAQAGYLRLFFLEVNGTKVSSAICFDYGGWFSIYNSGYDVAYSSLSVGLLLKAFCLKEAIAAGRRCFDFLRGAEYYKYDLGATDMPVYSITVHR
ncbi:MAG: GNAT family N-acetyltransferase [Dehalococcoidia bacterium]